MLKRRRIKLRTLSADTSCELDVLRHDCDALCVDRAQIRVLEQANEVRLRSLLKGYHSGGLEAKVRLEVLCDLSHEALERKLPDQKLRRLLVPADLPKGDRPGAVTMRLLHSSRRGSRFTSRFRRELLTRWCFSSSAFASRLFRASHFLGGCG